MTYRLVFETTADKRRFVDLAGEELSLIHI